MTRRVLLLVAAALALVVGGGTAFAYWTASSSTNAAGQADTLKQGTTPGIAVAYSGGFAQVTATFGSVTTAQRSASATSYSLRRYNVPTGGAPVSTTSCTSSPCKESSVPSGNWYYADAAVIGNWVGPESARTAVTVDTTRHLSIATIADQTQNAPFGVTVTALNSDGTTDGTFTGAVTLSKSSGPGSLSCTSNQVNASGGQASFSGCKLDTAGAYILSAAASGITGASSNQFQVAATTASKFSLTVASSQKAGTQFDVKVCALNADNSANTAYAGVHSPSWTTTASAAPNGTGPGLPSGSLTFDSKGCATAKATLYKAEPSVTITATDGSISGTSSSITVVPGSLTKLAWTATSASPGSVSNCFFTCSVSGLGKNGGKFTAKVMITDDYGNLPQPSLSGSHSVSLSITSGNGGSVSPTTAVTIGSDGISVDSWTVTAPSNNGFSLTVTAKPGTSDTYVSATATLSP